MKKPTSKALIAWWEAQPKGPRTCTDCGKTDDAAYVQPQHPYYASGRTGEARCTDCITAANKRSREARREELRAAPHCQVGQCEQRGAFRVGGAAVLMCGRHKKQAERAHNRNMESMPGGMALFMAPPAYSAETLLAMAERGG